MVGPCSGWAGGDFEDEKNAALQGAAFLLHERHGHQGSVGPMDPSGPGGVGVAWGGGELSA